MHRFQAVLAVSALATCVAFSSAHAVDVTVLGTANPWDPTITNGVYGTSGATGPTSLAVSPGDNLTITYLSGLTSSFGEPNGVVDASGYTYLPFGSGPGQTGQGYFTALPSFYIDPTNSGPANIYLNALLGDFVNGAGMIIPPITGGGANGAFATGLGPFSVIAPPGAVKLQLGLNDDNFADNGGSLTVSVTRTSVLGTPGPIAGAGLVPLLGLAGGYLFGRRRKLAA